MNCLLRCEYDMDTGCVELRFMDGTQISIDCRAVETVLDANTLQRGELDWLIYNNRWSMHRWCSAVRSKHMSRDERNTG